MTTDTMFIAQDKYIPYNTFSRRIRNSLLKIGSLKTINCTEVITELYYYFRSVFTSVSRVYAEANILRPSSYYDFENQDISWSGKDRYELISQIGKGRFGVVFESFDLQSKSIVALKVLHVTFKKRILREIKILRNLNNGVNIIKLLDVVAKHQEDSALVFEYVKNTEFKGTSDVFTDNDVRFYIYELLKGLDYCHSMGIMHRDVKPQNIVIDHEKRKLKIIDWGLADFYHPGHEYTSHVASRYYKAPELLIDYPMYDYGVDLWPVGCILAQMIFKMETFFKGVSNSDQLLVIARAMGTDDLFSYIMKFNIWIDEGIKIALGYHHRKKWETFINAANKNHVLPDAIELLNKLLVYDHSVRISAKEAMQCSYFSPIIKKNV